MKKLRWVGGIYVFGPDEEWKINDFIDFFETGAANEDIIDSLRNNTYPILTNIKKELKIESNSPPFMGNKRSIKA